MLEDQSDFFHQGEWQVLTSGKRFLATIGILTCIGVFAWTNKGRKGGSTDNKTITFGAHIDAEYYFGGKTFYNGDSFALLRRFMTGAFGQTNPADIQCYVVGDHKLGSPGANCLHMGAELVSSLQSAGYQVRTELFKAFPGATLNAWTTNLMHTNNSLYRSNQCFFFVALDSVTGKLIAHTRLVDENHPCPMWPARVCDVERNGSGARQFDKNRILMKSSGSFRA